MLNTVAMNGWYYRDLRSEQPDPPPPEGPVLPYSMPINLPPTPLFPCDLPCPPRYRVVAIGIGTHQPVMLTAGVSWDPKPERVLEGDVVVQWRLTE